MQIKHLMELLGLSRAGAVRAFLKGAFGCGSQALEQRILQISQVCLDTGTNGLVFINWH
jgi:hypothetical protein